AEDCAFVLVCGDVFESNALPRRVVARACEAMREIPVPVYLLPGNHDPLDAASIYDSPTFLDSAPEHVHVLRGTEPVAVGGDVWLLPAPWTSKHPTADALAPAVTHLLPRADDGAAPGPGEVTGAPARPGEPGAVRIVAGHGAVDTLSPDAHDPSVISTPGLRELLDAGTIAYVAHGDRPLRCTRGHRLHRDRPGRRARGRPGRQPGQYHGPPRRHLVLPRPTLRRRRRRGRGCDGPGTDPDAGEVPHRAASGAARHAHPHRARSDGGGAGTASGDVRLGAGVAAAHRRRRARLRERSDPARRRRVRRRGGRGA